MRFVKRVRLWVPGISMLAWALAMGATAQDVPHLQRVGKVTQLIVDGKPFVMLGGELSNSAASTAAEADAILPGLTKAYVNTVLIPVAWEEIEPVEGRFDFAVPDHWIEIARDQHMHLVLLWFGSWKNGVSSYTPAWVKADPKRFPRAMGEDGRPLEVLSTLSENTVEADAKAFRALMKHVRETDAKTSTVLMVQVENEVGLGGSTRDRSTEADKEFAKAVPEKLLGSLRERRQRLEPEMVDVRLNERGTWSEVFGNAAPEAFMAWHYATYIDRVAAAGESEYPLPMFTNAQLPAAKERAGEYPSGGPHPGMLDIWKAAGTAINFHSPDIYWPEFAYWVDRYAKDGNAVFVPEARLDAGPWNAFYALGEADGMGFSPFSIDDLVAKGKPEQSDLGRAYGVLAELTPLLPAAQAKGLVRGLVLHANSPRSSQTVALGGYLFHAEMARSWPARALMQDDGAMLVLQMGPSEFLVAGSGIQLAVRRDRDSGAGGGAEVVSVDEGRVVNGAWVAGRRLNGDQTDQGRGITLPAHGFQVLRVVVQ